MLKKISSLKITFFCLGLLIGSLLIGVALTFDKNHAASLKSLSRQLPLKWLINESASDFIITTWFVFVCLVAGVFFIHLICCILTRFFRLIQNGFSPRQWLFFLIHMMFVLVMLCHGLSMILGYKLTGISLFAGQTTRFDKDYILLLSDVRFVDDPAILKVSYENQRSMMTRSNIHKDKNYADITLMKENRILTSGRIYMLKPLQFGSIRITMTEFFIPENRPDDPIGVKLVITNNPVTPFFFAAYAIMIISLIGFVIITWRNEAGGKLELMNITSM